MENPWRYDPAVEIKLTGARWLSFSYLRYGKVLFLLKGSAAKIVSLLPEGWLVQVLRDKDERALLRSGKRYTSNITIVEQESELRQLPQDVLLTPLAGYTKRPRLYRRQRRTRPGRNRGELRPHPRADLRPRGDAAPLGRED